MGSIWMKKVSLIGPSLILIVSLSVQSVCSESGEIFGKAFYDPKYHDDGRDTTKIIEYRPLESSNVFSFEPSTSQREYHDINPGNGISTLNSIPSQETNPIFTKNIAEIPRNPGQSSITKALSHFKESFSHFNNHHNNNNNRPLGVFEVHPITEELSPPKNVEQSGKVTWPNSDNGNIQSIQNTQSYHYHHHLQNPLVSLSPSPTASSSYNNVPVIHADPVYYNNENNYNYKNDYNEDYQDTFSRFPLSEYPPSVPIPPQTEIKQSPYSSSFTFTKSHGYEPTIFKEFNHPGNPPSYNEYVHEQPNNQRPLSAFYPEMNGDFKPQSYSISPVPIVSQFTEELRDGPLSTSSYGVPPAQAFNNNLQNIQAGLGQVQGQIKSKFQGALKSISSFFQFAGPKLPQTVQEEELPLTSHYTKGQPQVINYEHVQDSYRPVLNSGYNYNNYKAVPQEISQVPQRIPNPVTTSSYSSKPLSSFYESPGKKFPEFGDGVTITHTSYPAEQISDFDLEDFSHFRKPEYTSQGFDDFDDFSDDGPENSYGFKKPSSIMSEQTPTYSYGEIEDEDLKGWSHSPFSALYASIKRPTSSYSSSSVLKPGYSPGGWSNYGSYKSPIPANHPASYFAKGQSKIKYGTPYDLVHSPNYGNYYKNKFGGWERSPSPLKGYRYRYSTLHYPGTNPLNLPSEYSNNPPEEHNYDCENRHSCGGGGQSNLGISENVDLTRRPSKGRRRFRNTFFKRLIRNLAGKRKPRRRPNRRPCRGRRC